MKPRLDVPLPLAKITEPRSPKALARSRLFSRLANLSESQALWIYGSPGSGKSTLIASHLRQTSRTVLWYQCDDGDADPGNFFLYFVQALQRTARRKKIIGLPFGAEFRDKPIEFGRMLFRSILPHLPENTSLVFDNLQTVDGTPLPDILLACIDEITADQQVILISHSLPGARYASLLAKRRMAVLPEQELKFSLDEAMALLAETGQSASVAERIHGATGGWAAGLVLAAEHLKANPEIGEFQPESNEYLFSYFANEILSRVPDETRRFLQETALLPHVVESLAVELTGNRQARKILDDLGRRRFFVEQRGVEESAAYYYHTLFKGYLLRSGQAERGREDWQELSDRAAAILARHGLADAAIGLYLSTKRWDLACEQLGRVAERWLGEGRRETFERLCMALPGEVLNEQRWLCYWLGLSSVQTDEAVARRWFDRAYDGFASQNDDQGRLLAASAMVQAYCSEYGNLTGLIVWLKRFRAAWNVRKECLAPGEELQALIGRMAVFILSDGSDHADRTVETEAIRLFALISAHDDRFEAAQRLAAAHLLLDVARLEGNHERALQLITAIVPMARDDNLSPLLRTRWLISQGHYHFITGNFERAAAAWNEAAGIIETFQLKSAKAAVLIHKSRLLLATGKQAGVREHLDELERCLSPDRIIEMSDYLLIRGRYLLQNGQPREALTSLTNAETAASLGGLLEPQLIVLRLERVYALLALGCWDDALVILDNVAAMESGANLFAVRAVDAFTRALQTRSRDNDRYYALLQQAFSLLRASRNTGVLRPLNDMLARLCADALDHGIEEEFVQTVIKTRRLAPPPDTGAYWPWPLRLRCFGDFNVIRDGQPLVFAGKVQKKPLELLKILVSGAHPAFDGAWLTEQLWPEAEGDAGRVNLDVTIARLRKLLAIEDAILLQEGKLRINRKLVWTDVIAFFDAVDQAARISTDAPEAEATRVGRAISELYRGELFGNETGQPWMLSARERVKQKFVQVVDALSRYWLAAGKPEMSFASLERAVFLEPLAEMLHRRLMEQYLAAGSPAEAMRAYRRCKQMLSIIAGTTPSAETERLRSKIYES